MLEKAPRSESLMNTEERESVMKSVKLLDEFAKSVGNGWIYLDTAQGEGSAELKASSYGLLGSPKVEMSVTLRINPIMELFNVRHVEESAEDGVAGSEVSVNNYDELQTALRKPGGHFLASLK